MTTTADVLTKLQEQHALDMAIRRAIGRAVVGLTFESSVHSEDDCPIVGLVNPANNRYPWFIIKNDHVETKAVVRDEHNCWGDREFTFSFAELAPLIADELNKS